MSTDTKMSVRPFGVFFFSDGQTNKMFIRNKQFSDEQFVCPSVRPRIVYFGRTIRSSVREWFFSDGQTNCSSETIFPTDGHGKVLSDKIIGHSDTLFKNKSNQTKQATFKWNERLQNKIIDSDPDKKWFVRVFEHPNILQTRFVHRICP